MAIKPLNNHYSMENPASIYDEEALTALQLAGRTTAKVNETVEAFNELETRTGERLDRQDQAIPVKVQEEFQKNVNDGTFADMVDEYAGGLTSRVDHLLGQTVPGGTTMDAEVIDGRTDGDGNAWSTLGNSIRGQVGNLARKVNDLCEQVYTDVTPVTFDAGFVDTAGTFTANASYIATSYNVAPGDIFYIKASYGWSQPVAVAVDASGKALRVYQTANATTYEVYEHPVIIPENAVKLWVSSFKSYGMGVRKITGYTLNQGDIVEYTNNLAKVTQTGTPVSHELEHTITPSKVLGPEYQVSDLVEGNEKYHIYEVNVNPGDTVIVSGSGGFGNAFYGIFDNNGTKISGKPSGTYDGYIPFEETVIVPLRGAKIIANGHDTMPAGVRLVTGYQTPASGLDWSHLKWACMGDSLTEVNIRTTKRYFDYVQDKTGIQVVNMGVSGSGYKKMEDSNQAFYQRIVNVPTDCDVVTFFGSGNDGGTGELGDPSDTGTTTICGCINTALDNLYEVMPTVQVGVVSPTPWGHQNPENENCFMFQYSNALKAICQRRGIPFLDLYRLSGFRTMKNGVINAETHDLLFSKDPVGNNTHPNELGHKIMSSHFYAFLQSLIGTY